MIMSFHVFDTYVKSKNGHIMYFDVITDKNDIEKDITFAKEWLKSIQKNNAKVTTEEIEIEIMTSGYFIAKMDGCP